MCDLEKRQPSVSQAPHPLPGQPCALAAAPKRHEPVPHGLGAKGIQRPLIARHAVVVGVPAKNAGEPAPLLWDGLIAATEQLAPEGVQLRPRPLRVGDALELKTSAPGLPADVREAKEPEPPRLAETPLGPLLGGEPPETNQPRLFGIQLQAELREPVAKVRPEPLGIAAVLESHHEVVSETRDDDVTARVPGSPENDGLHWPRRDGLKWPHLASVVVGVDVA